MCVGICIHSLGCITVEMIFTNKCPTQPVCPAGVSGLASRLLLQHMQLKHNAFARPCAPDGF